MRIGSKVACNRPSNSGNAISFGIVASFTQSGAWVDIEGLQFFYPMWAMRVSA